MRKFLAPIVIVFMALFASPCWAEIPHLISYQGMLTDDDGNPLNGSYNLTFSIYSDPTDGSLLWTESHAGVSVEDGLFNLILGTNTPIPSSVFDDTLSYLGITVESDPELSPRIRFTSFGYAYRAEWADTSDYSFRAQKADTAIYAIQTGSAEPDGDWTISANNIYSAVSGNVGIGTSSPAAKLDVSGDVNTGSVYKIVGSTVLSTSGTENIFVGLGAGANNTGGYGTFVGNNAGYNNQADENTFIGGDAGYSNTIGYGNAFVGMEAGYGNTTGVSNTFLGIRAGRNNTAGHNNTFVGWNVGLDNSLGFRNTFLGAAAGKYNTIGDGNTFIGERTGFSNTTGDGNTFIGMFTGYGNSTGSSNTFLGAGAGGSNTTGYTNTYLGRRSGFHNSTGSGNIFIGDEAGLYETGSNKLCIANGPYTSNVLIYGDFSTGRVGIGTLSPAYTLDVNGDINVEGSYNIKKGGENYIHPDYVFEPDYDLMPLDELRKYVFKNKCLPNVISAGQVKKNNGFKMDELLIQMLEKIEEQTLYIFQLEERIVELEKR